MSCEDFSSIFFTAGELSLIDQASRARFKTPAHPIQGSISSLDSPPFKNSLPRTKIVISYRHLRFWRNIPIDHAHLMWRWPDRLFPSPQPVAWSHSINQWESREISVRMMWNKVVVAFTRGRSLDDIRFCISGLCGYGWGWLLKKRERIISAFLYDEKCGGGWLGIRWREMTKNFFFWQERKRFEVWDEMKWNENKS